MKEEMKEDKKIILWEVNSFPAIDIKSYEEEREDHEEMKIAKKKETDRGKGFHLKSSSRMNSGVSFFGMNI